MAGAERPGLLRRIASVLDAVSGDCDGLSLAEITELTGLPRSTSHRLLSDLVKIGYIEATADRSCYRLGQNLLGLLHLGVPSGAIAPLVGKPLRAMVDQFGETALLARLGRADIEIAHVETPQERARRSYFHPGFGPTPAHACSTAKAVLAFQPDDVVERFLERNLTRFTSRTLTSRQKLRAEIGRVRGLGYAVCDQEIDPGVFSVAAPVHLPRVGVIYAVAIVGPAERMAEHGVDALVGALRKSTTSVVAAIEGARNRVRPSTTAEERFRSRNA